MIEATGIVSGAVTHRGATRRRAVIDVGTNSVKLLVADLAQGTVCPVWEESTQTRLGQGACESRVLSADAIARTARAVRCFVEKARSHGVALPKIAVIATSAARDALNQQNLLLAIQEESGVRARIISGEQEAEWAYLGVTTVHDFARRPALVFDVGGGSTQFILGQEHTLRLALSYKLGTVRTIDRLRLGDPPSPSELAHCRESVEQFLIQEAQPDFGPLLGSLPERAILVASGGSASILARLELALPQFDREAMEALHLSRDGIGRWVETLWSVLLEERKRLVGMPEKHADVILAGSVIYETALRLFDFPELRVSTHGLRFAAVMHTFQ